jgi:ABC-type glycerol-3-phosphate transport system permease component
MSTVEQTKAEGRRMTDEQKAPEASVSSFSLHPSSFPIHPRPTAGRLTRYVLARGWLHLTLLCGVALFLFPFVWMVATSLKTDEELTSPRWWPHVPTFRAASPYIDPPSPLERPAGVMEADWDRVLPDLMAEARGALAAGNIPVWASSADPAMLRDAASLRLTGAATSRMDVSLWQRPRDDLHATFRALLTPDAVAAAMDASIMRLDLRSLQVRTNGAHLFKIPSTRWHVESGPADVIDGPTGQVVHYSFPDANSPPVVLRCDFNLPCPPADWHKLILTLGPDDSWHQVDAQLDLAGTRWTSTRSTYLAQTRTTSISFQPPSFDDETLRAKTWVPMRQVAADTPSPGPSTGPTPATLRLTLHPSSTLAAVAGKVTRNYARAFYAVPFWTYVGNSLLLVTLGVAGTLFSTAFVAYGFARLRWPGRSVAFVVLLATMMLPAQVTMIPTFLIWRHLGWYNTLNPLWVPALLGSAFFIFLMVQQMKTIPIELEEAARIDGLGPFRTWAYIILPQVKPTLAAVAIMSFMGAWNDLLGPLVYLRDQAKFPLSLGLFALQVDYGADWTLIMAGNVLMTLPVILIFFLFQRHFIEGATMTGMKG